MKAAFNTKLLAGICALALAACGDSGGGEEGCTVDGGSASPKNLFPLVQAATWTLDITDPLGAPLGVKTQTVTGTTTLSGVDGSVFVLETNRPDGVVVTSFQKDIGAAVVRYSEDRSFGATLLGREVYDPCKLRTPKTLYSAGATLAHTFRETAYDNSGGVLSVLDKTETFVVEQEVSITVPAGTFNNPVKLHRTTAPTSADKLFWYVEGVGKVREQGGGQTEELRCYRIPGGTESCGLCDVACQPL